MRALVGLIFGLDKTRPVPMWDEDGKRIGYVAPVPEIPAVRDFCDFCHCAFEHRVQWLPKRRRRTCSTSCAVSLRKRLKQARAMERFRVARAARWLSWPKEVVLDGE